MNFRESRAPAQGASPKSKTAHARLHNVYSIRNNTSVASRVKNVSAEIDVVQRCDQTDTYPQLLHDFEQVFEAYSSLLLQYAHLVLELSDQRQEHILHCELPFHFHRDALHDIHTTINFAKGGCLALEKGGVN